MGIKNALQTVGNFGLKLGLESPGEHSGIR